MAEQPTADSGTPAINPVADAFEGLKADLTQFLTEPAKPAAGDGATPAADADGDEPNDLSQDTQASEPAADDAAEAPTETPAAEDAPDMSDLNLSAEARQKLGAKVSERIREAKAKYKAEAEEARAAMELELSEAKAKLAELQAAKTETIQPTTPLPTNFEDEAKKANDAIRTVDRLMRRLDSHPAHVAQQLVELGVVAEVSDPDDPKVQDELLAKLETIRDNAAAAGRKALESAQKFQAAYQASSARALKLMPELRDPKSEQNKLLREVIEQAPWIKGVPNWPEAAMRQVLGIMNERELAARVEAKAGKPAAKPPAVPKSRATLPAQQVREPGMSDAERTAGILGESPEARRRLMRTLLGT